MERAGPIFLHVAYSRDTTSMIPKTTSRVYVIPPRRSYSGVMIQIYNVLDTAEKNKRKSMISKAGLFLSSGMRLTKRMAKINARCMHR